MTRSPAPPGFLRDVPPGVFPIIFGMTILMIALLAAQEPVDVLSKIDLRRDAVAGEWKLDARVLVSPAVPLARLKLAVDVPPDYELSLTAELAGPAESLNIGLPLRGGAVMLVINGWQGGASGLHEIDGRPAIGNETTVKGPQFVPNVPRRILCSVRGTRIRVSLDGKRLIDWRGDPSRLRVPADWAVGGLFLGSYATSYRISRIDLTPLEPGPEMPKPAPPPPLPPRPSAEEAARFSRSAAVGGPGGGGFEDAVRAPALLVGFRLTTSWMGQATLVKAARPIYQTKDGAVEGPWYGSPWGASWTVLAKPGYAVGGLRARGEQRVEHLRVVFMRIGDPTDTYESEPFGGMPQSDDRRLGGDGRPVVGIFGGCAEDIDRLGLIQADLPAADLALLRDLDPSRRPTPGLHDSSGDALPLGARLRLGSARLRDSRGITAFAWSPDGARLALCGGIGTIRVAEASTGRTLLSWRLPGYTSAYALHFDGRTLAAACADAKLRIYDASSGRELAVAPCAKDGALASDGKRLAVTQEDGSLAILDPATGREAARFMNAGKPMSIAYSPDGSKIVGGSFESGVRLWDVEGDGVVLGEGRGVTAVAFTPDGLRVVARRRDGSVTAYDVKTGAVAREYESAENPVAFQRAPYGALAVCGKTGLLAAASFLAGPLRLRALSDGALLRELPALAGGIRAMRFSPDGAQLAVLGNDKSFRLMDPATGLRSTIAAGHEGFVRSVVWTPDGRGLLTGGVEGSVRLWDAGDGAARWTVESRGGYSHRAPTLALLPDGTSFLEGSGRRIFRRKLADGSEIPWPKDVEPSGTNFVVSPAARRVFVLEERSGLAAWSLDAWARTTILENSSVSAWWGLDVAPDGRSVATMALTHGRGEVWGLGDGRKEPRFVFQGPKTKYWSGGCPFSPDGRRLAISASSAAIAILDAQTGRQESTWSGHPAEVSSLAWSPDGRLLATADWQGSIRVWEAASGREAFLLDGGVDVVYAVAFSPDGRELAAGGQDCAVLIWSLVPPAPPGSPEAWWDLLAEESPARAFPAVLALAALGEKAVDFLRPRLDADRPSKRGAALLALLDTDDLARREEAHGLLMEEDAEEAVARALPGATDVERRGRLQQLLSTYRDLEARNPYVLRAIRAVDVLERVGGPSARALLETLSKGPEGRRAREAKSALLRLRS